MKVLVNCEKVPLTALLNSQAIVIIVTRPAPTSPARPLVNHTRPAAAARWKCWLLEENHLKVVTMTCVASQLPASGLGRMETGILHFTFHINVEPKVGADDTPHINMFNEY